MLEVKVIRSGEVEETIVASNYEEADNILLSKASDMIWNFDEYTPCDIDNILENGVVEFGDTKIIID